MKIYDSLKPSTPWPCDFLFWYFHSTHHSSKGLEYLLILQSIDDRVQQWNHDCVHKGSLPGGIQPVCLLSFHTCNDTAAIHQRENNEVRWTGGESFLSLLDTIVNIMLLFVKMIMIRNVNRIHKVRTKASISTDLVSEQERWASRLRSQKKWGMTWGPQNDNWETFTIRPVIRVKPEAKQAVIRKKQILRFMMAK